MDSLRALGSGLLGAVTLTLLHETTRKYISDAPRMDILGEEALSKMMKRLGIKQSFSGEKLHNLTLAGDVFSNALFYSLMGFGKKKNSFLFGSLLGLSAGLGAIFLPAKLGLSKKASKKTNKTVALTIALYLLGGIASAAAQKYLLSTDNNNGSILTSKYMFSKN